MYLYYRQVGESIIKCDCVRERSKTTDIFGQFDKLI